MKKILRILAVSVVLSLSFGVLGIHLAQSGFFEIKDVQVFVENDDSSRFSSLEAFERVYALAEKIRGQDLFQVNLKEFETQLSGESWIKSYRISRRWPAKLEVRIKPQRVYFSILTDKGRLIPVIENGQMLEDISVARAPQAPVTRQSQFVSNAELRTRAAQTLKNIPIRGEFSRQNISEIEYDKANGFLFTLTRGDLKVKLGETNVREKSLQVSQVLHYLGERQIQARVIDANLSQKVLVRLRKDP